ncbi:hypothetical protein [Streptomyces sp. NBC_01455]|uniref:hypothetical protein n=1 Tax=Streptomyces sp. NBC_01455 TaxID=2903874 RepID=UPI002E30D441|nr:hypothetical protein [Streptomyces sp. NBC_01455]
MAAKEFDRICFDFRVEDQRGRHNPYTQLQHISDVLKIYNDVLGNPPAGLMPVEAMERLRSFPSYKVTEAAERPGGLEEMLATPPTEGTRYGRTAAVRSAFKDLVDISSLSLGNQTDVEEIITQAAWENPNLDPGRLAAISAYRFRRNRTAITLPHVPDALAREAYDRLAEMMGHRPEDGVFDPSSIFGQVEAYAGSSQSLLRKLLERQLLSEARSIGELLSHFAEEAGVLSSRWQIGTSGNELVGRQWAGVGSDYAGLDISAIAITESGSTLVFEAPWAHTGPVYAVHTTAKDGRIAVRLDDEQDTTVYVSAEEFGHIIKRDIQSGSAKATAIVLAVSRAGSGEIPHTIAAITGLPVHATHQDVRVVKLRTTSDGRTVSPVFRLQPRDEFFLGDGWIEVRPNASHLPGPQPGGGAEVAGVARAAARFVSPMNFEELKAAAFRARADLYQLDNADAGTEPLWLRFVKAFRRRAYPEAVNDVDRRLGWTGRQIAPSAPWTDVTGWRDIDRALQDKEKLGPGSMALVIGRTPDGGIIPRDSWTIPGRDEHLWLYYHPRQSSHPYWLDMGLTRTERIDASSRVQLSRSPREDALQARALFIDPAGKFVSGLQLNDNATVSRPAPRTTAPPPGVSRNDIAVWTVSTDHDARKRELLETRLRNTNPNAPEYAGLQAALRTHQQTQPEPNPATEEATTSSAQQTPFLDAPRTVVGHASRPAAVSDAQEATTNAIAAAETDADISPLKGSASAPELDEEGADPQSVLRTEKALTAAARDVVAGIGTKAGLENCVELTASMLERLFPMGIRGAGTRDDAALGLNRVEERLVRGGTWSSPLSSIEQVRDALSEAGPGSVAILLEQRKTKGHVWLHVHLGYDPEVQKIRTAHVDLQVTPQVQLYSEGLRQAIRAGRGTRMIIIEATGQAVTLPTAMDSPQSLSTSQTLFEAPTGHDYGAFGFEIERADQPIRAEDKSPLEYGDILATNVHSGTSLVVEKGAVYVVNGRSYVEAAQARVANKNVPVPAIPVDIIEEVSGVYAILPGENRDRVELETGLRQHGAARKILGKATETRRDTRLRELLAASDGWKLTDLGRKIIVSPAIGGGAFQPYTQFTVGSNIAGADFLIALAHESNAKPGGIFLEKARSFSNALSVHFARWRLGDNGIGVNDLPYLKAALPELREISAYLWLAFNHASAGPVAERFYPNSLIKNMLPMAMRNPFHVVRASLNANVQKFLESNSQAISSQFEMDLNSALQRHARLVSPTMRFQSFSWSETTGTNKGVKVVDYLTSMVRGTVVRPYHALGMHDHDYNELDRSNGHLPLALFEFRSLAPGMSDDVMQSTARFLSDLANSAHRAALPVHASGVARTPSLVSRILRDPLVQQMKIHLPQIASLPVSNAHGRVAPLISHLDRLRISEAVAESAAFDQPMSSTVKALLVSAGQKLNGEMARSTQDVAQRDALHRGYQSLNLLLGAISSPPRTGYVPARAPRVTEPAHVGDTSRAVPSGMGVEQIAGWNEARAEAVPRRSAGEWVDPVAEPMGSGAHAPRYVVASDFDVRAFEIEGIAYSDLTVRVVLAPGEGVSAEQADAVWERALTGVEEVFNRPGEVLPDQSVLHVTLERVTLSDDPHLQVTAVPADAVMDQQHWTVDASALAVAHEFGHQFQAKDEHSDPSAPNRFVSDGSIMGDFHKPAPEGMAQAGLRPRHLQVIYNRIEAAQDLESFARGKRVAALRSSRPTLHRTAIADVAIAPQLRTSARGGLLAGEWRGVVPVRREERENGYQFVLDSGAIEITPQGFAVGQVKATVAEFDAALNLDEKGVNVSVRLSEADADTARAVQFLSATVNQSSPLRGDPLTIVLVFPHGGTVNICANTPKESNDS